MSEPALLALAALPLAQQDASLRELAERRWQALCEAHPEHRPEPRLRDLLALSDFLGEGLLRYPELYAELTTSGDFACAERREQARQRLSQSLAGCSSETELHAALRRHRRREMLIIAYRDLAGLASLEEALAHLSALADDCIGAALAWLYAKQCQETGTPYGDNGERQEMLVLGMGKLGAGELNFSSDIDLIFTYPELGETRGGARAVPTDAFFTRLGQRLIAALDKPSADGFVFRVDMRLRPYGDSGPLVMCFDAMEDYYQDQGREWERYAMIKARVVAGPEAAAARLYALLKPFVYRRYIDFSVMQSLREMKALITREMRRKGLNDNLKLGPGGIREIEFIAQVFQLIRGGRDIELQTRSLLQVLPLVGARGLIEPEAVAELMAAYHFLRKAEHALQAIADQQTQTLPADPFDRARLAAALGFADWDSFYTTLNAHRDRVEAQFRVLIGEPEDAGAKRQEHAALAGVWEGSFEAGAAVERLREAGFDAPDSAWNRLQALREGAYIRVLAPRGRGRLDSLLPALLAAIGAGPEPDATLARTIALIEGIGRRTAYLELLAENPGARELMLRLLAQSPWIAERLAQHPFLLDELLDPRALYQPGNRNQLADELRQLRLRIDPRDEEQQMDALREFKNAQMLRVAAADIAGHLDVVAVSRHLTDLAEVLLGAVLESAWISLVARHGTPPGTSLAAPGFAVIAYGKFGGRELGYGSDLDLVFLHSGDAQALTEGDKPVSLGQFYARLAQRIVHWLSTRTGAGLLYETDTRLRPSGNAGLLVAALDAFAEYQEKEAWTWEHQALVRARPVVGDADLAQAFGAVRARILERPREPAALTGDVRAMRERMREHLAPNQSDRFNLKHDAGGIVDIEFLAQWGVLAHAHAEPRLLEVTGTAEILNRLGRLGRMAPEEAERLGGAFASYRASSHAAALQNRKAEVDAGEFVAERAAVRQVWQHYLGG